MWEHQQQIRDTGAVSTTVLLDTNVWSYVADDSAANELDSLRQKHDLEILVAPTAVLEQFRVSNRSVRDRLLNVTTDDRWTRLMPEAFVACREIVHAARRHRPDWIVESPSREALRAYSENEEYWICRFWSEAHLAPDDAYARTADTDQASADLARGGLREGRRITTDEDVALDGFSLDSAEFRVDVTMADGTTDRLPAWQVSTAVHAADALFGPLADTTYHDWLAPYVETAVARNTDDWLRFWADLEPADAPTHWVWWAGAMCAQFVKINDGAPADVNWTAYLTDPDVFVTADRRLHRIATKIHNEAPIPTPTPLLATPGQWRDTIASASGAH